MADLINRGALYKAFYERDCDAMELDGILDVVANFPTIAAEPVVHARWVQDATYTDLAFCSACLGGDFSVSARKKLKYCPGCGARMDADAPPRATDHFVDANKKDADAPERDGKDVNVPNKDAPERAGI